jgi:hypothetical protein
MLIFSWLTQELTIPLVIPSAILEPHVFLAGADTITSPADICKAYVSEGDE